MKLFTTQHYAKLYANWHAAQVDTNFDPWPVVKLYSPNGACKWLVTAVEPLGDRLSRLSTLTDNGFGRCEYQTIFLKDLLARQDCPQARIERDRFWTPQGPISAYIKASNGERLVDHLPATEGGAV